jgi:hypothetical protein
MLTKGLPVVQFRNKSLITYYEPTQPGSGTKSLFRQQNLKTNRGTRYSGKMTVGSKKRLERVLTLLVQSAKRKWIYNEVTQREQLHHISFITLTIATDERNLSAKEAYEKLLKHFLQWMRRTAGAKSYVWKAELQNRGQIHYHITTPTFINFQAIRDKWNNLQRQAGLLEGYYRKKGHYDPNSTDVHEVYKLKDVAGYLIKEITKNVQNETATTGKIWDCSENLKANKYFCVPLTREVDRKLKEHEWKRRTVTHQGDYFTLVHLCDVPLSDVFNEMTLSEFNSYINSIREWTPAEKGRKKHQEPSNYRKQSYEESRKERLQHKVKNRRKKKGTSTSTRIKPNPSK